MGLNLTQVRAFVAVIDAGGFLEAARALGCSQPAVTQLVRKLEAQLATPLIVRHRKAPVATRDGERFLPHARRLLRAEERALSSIAGQSLVIGASGNVGTYLLPRFIKRFTEESGVGANLVIGTNPMISDRIEAGEVDVAVLEWWDDRPGFVSGPWRCERLVVIVAPDHPWAGIKSIPAEKLFDTAMIGGEPGSGTGQLLKNAYGKDAARIGVSMNLGSTAAVKEAVKAGLGVSLVLKSSVAEELQNGTLAAVEVQGVPLQKDLVTVIPENVPASAPSVRFLSLLGEVVAAGRGQHPD